MSGWLSPTVGHPYSPTLNGFNPTSYTPFPNVIMMFFSCTNRERERERERERNTHSIPHLFLHDYEYICIPILTENIIHMYVC